MDDEEIRGALRRGDVEAAFRLVQRRYGAAVYSICRRVLRDPSAAEDAMQQTLIAAFRSRSQLLGVDQVRGWLIRIAIRKCIDARRSSRRTDRLHRALGDEGDAGPVDGADVLKHLVTAEEHRAVEECLATLAPDVAAAVLMRHHEGMSWEQIAEALTLPLDTIRMRVNRGALQRLRVCLEAKGIKL